MKRLAFLGFMLLACSLASGCGDDDDGGNSSGQPGPVESVVVYPERARIVVGDIVQFTAQGFDRGGRPVAVSPIWSVSPEFLGQIDQDGTFVANCVLGTGVVKASVNAGSLKLSATSLDTLVESSGGAPVLLDVEPDTITVEAGGAFAQIFVSAIDAVGTPVAVEPVWELLPGHLGVVNEMGLFQSGEVPGVGAIEVTVGDLTTDVFVQVIVTEKRSRSLERDPRPER